MAEAARRALEQKNNEEIERLRARRKSEEAQQEELLRKAVEEVRAAREAARIAEEQKFAAVTAADLARKAAEEAKSEADARVGRMDGDRVRLAALPKLPSPEETSGPFDGRWAVTRTGVGKCGRGRVVTFQVVIVNGSVNKGRGSVTASGVFKFAGPSLDANDAIFNGTIRGSTGSGTMYHPHCRGTFTMKRL